MTRGTMTLLLIIGMLAVASIAVLGLVKSERILSEAKRSTSDDMEELKAELARLRSQQTVLGSVLGASLQGGRLIPLVAPGQQGEAGAAHSVNTPVDPELRLQRQQEQIRASAKLLADTLAHEQPDSNWSPKANQLIERAFSKPDLSAMKYTADCRQTLCRVEFKSDIGNSHEHTMHTILANSPWDGQAFMEDDGKGNGTIYFARQGHELPRADLTAN